VRRSARRARAGGHVDSRREAAPQDQEDGEVGRGGGVRGGGDGLDREWLGRR
jgi:hypothetical protein